MGATIQVGVGAASAANAVEHLAPDVAGVAQRAVPPDDRADDAARVLERDAGAPGERAAVLAGEVEHRRNLVDRPVRRERGPGRRGATSSASVRPEAGGGRLTHGFPVRA